MAAITRAEISEHLGGIASQRVADEMVALPVLHFRRTTQLIEQLVIQRFTIH